VPKRVKVARRDGAGLLFGREKAATGGIRRWRVRRLFLASAFSPRCYHEGIVSSTASRTGPARRAFDRQWVFSRSCNRQLRLLRHGCGDRDAPRRWRRSGPRALRPRARTFR
jgi:hypothetical protein